MKSIRNCTEFTLRERGSKFYGFLFPCASVEEFDTELAELKKKYPDATHHCTAYRVLNEQLTEFHSDDGEPSGSAGLPILNVMKSFDLVNCGAVVVRYYGGSKLGKAGLIEAYSNTTKSCVENANLSDIKKMVSILVSYQYHQEKEITPIIQTFDLIEEQATFLESVSKIFKCPIKYEDQLIQSLQNLSYTGIKFEKMNYTFVML